MTQSRILIWILAAGMLFSSWSTVIAQPKTKLQPQTVKAFDDYMKDIEKDYQRILSGEDSFLWVDQQDPDIQRRVRRGEIVIIKERENVDIRGGIIHVRGASTFMPDIAAEDVVNLLRDYDRHKDVYPSAIDSKLLEAKGDTVKGYIRFMYKKVLTAVLNTEHESILTKLSGEKYAMRVRSTRIAEVENPGEPSEKELPVGEDSGFLWRMNTYWIIQQSEGGTFVECGSVTLTRGIPYGLGWLIRPFITGIPRDSLEEVMQGTRVALHE